MQRKPHLWGCGFLFGDGWRQPEKRYGGGSISLPKCFQLKALARLVAKPMARWQFADVVPTHQILLNTQLGDEPQPCCFSFQAASIIQHKGSLKLISLFQAALLGLGRPRHR